MAASFATTAVTCNLKAVKLAKNLHQIEFKTQLKSYFINHLRVSLSSLGRIYFFFVPSLMTIAVIGIALALPTGLYVTLQNAQNLSTSWDDASKISIYMQKSATLEQSQQLANKLTTDSRISDIELVDKQRGLVQFKAESGLENALKGLSTNPLPHVLIVEPKVNFNQADILAKLARDMQQQPHVDSVQMDMQWLKKLIGILALVQRALIVLAVMLALVVMLVIGNTIRLDIQNRSREIVVQKLIGATYGFIRRPFLYTGFWYGLFGGILAWFIVAVGLGFLRQPVANLADLYNSDFSLNHIELSMGFAMIGLSIILGLLGSWLAVGRHLHKIEPQLNY